MLALVFHNPSNQIGLSGSLLCFPHIPTKGKNHDCEPRNANPRNVDRSNLGKEHFVNEETAYRTMATFFCQSGTSPKSVEAVHFKKLTAYLNPKFCPSSAILSRYCLECTRKRKQKLKKF